MTHLPTPSLHDAADKSRSVAILCARLKDATVQQVGPVVPMSIKPHGLWSTLILEELSDVVIQVVQPRPGSMMAQATRATEEQQFARIRAAGMFRL